jgi:hypothetical protein
MTSITSIRNIKGIRSSKTVLATLVAFGAMFAVIATALAPASADAHWLSGSRARGAVKAKYAGYDNVANVRIPTCRGITSHKVKCYVEYLLQDDDGSVYECSELAKVRFRSYYSYNVKVVLYAQECQLA